MNYFNVSKTKLHTVKLNNPSRLFLPSRNSTSHFSETLSTNFYTLRTESLMLLFKKKKKKWGCNSRCLRMEVNQSSIRSCRWYKMWLYVHRACGRASFFRSVLLSQTFRSTSSCHFSSAKRWVNVSSSGTRRGLVNPDNNEPTSIPAICLKEVKCSPEWRHRFAAGSAFFSLRAEQNRAAPVHKIHRRVKGELKN